MAARLCICCGGAIDQQATLLNPNLCPTCARASWTPEDDNPVQDQREMAHSASVGAAPFSPNTVEIPADLSHLMEIEGPSVIECLEAELAAKRAIAEEASREIKELEAKLHSVAKLSPAHSSPLQHEHR